MWLRKKRIVTVRRRNKVLKRKKIVLNSIEYNIKYHDNDIMNDIEDEENLVEHVTQRVKMSIGGKKIPKNIPPIPVDNVYFHSKESVVKWKFVSIQKVGS